jgi:hypothetical protein
MVSPARRGALLLLLSLLAFATSAGGYPFAGVSAAPGIVLGG